MSSVGHVSGMFHRYALRKKSDSLRRRDKRRSFVVHAAP